MKDEIVKFETACLAKEKGFDWECREWYSKDGICKTLVYFQGDDGWIKNSDLSEYDISEYNISSTAPTQSLLQRWLYEKHGIWIDVGLNQFSKPKDLQWMYSILFTEDCTYSHSPKSFNSPTEAYEAAIEYVLTKLI